MTTIAGIRGQKVDTIIKGASEYYGVSVESLLTTCTARHGTMWKWKKYLVYVLFTHTDLDISEIKNLLAYKHYNTVNYHINNMKDEISESPYCVDKTKKGYSDLLKHLNL